MSKAVSGFFANFASAKRLVEKLSGKTVTPGARVVPVNKKDDKNAQLRIDAGEKIKGKQNLVLQVNSQATSPALKKWMNSNGRGSHGKLATATFDTGAADQDAEAERVAQELEKQAREKLG